MDKPIIFAASDYYLRFAMRIHNAYSGTTIGKVKIGRFPNGELHASVLQDVTNRDCMIVGSTAPPDEQLLILVTLADTLKRAGARIIHAFIPYLGYSRQDATVRGESGGIALVGALLRSSGIDSVMTIDVHSDKNKQLIGLPLTTLSPADLFAPYIRKLGWDDAVFVAPDKGAQERTRLLAHAVGNTRPITYLVKTHSDGVRHLDLIGTVSSRVILVDDILDTGQTLVSACELLIKQGVQEIVVVVTHGLFTEKAWGRLFSLGVTKLFVSDSCQKTEKQKNPDIEVVPVSI
jgi:ribose-phosphate pyrophosphokinase